MPDNESRITSPQNGPTVNKPTRFLIARDWLHRPGYRFRVLWLRRRLRKVRNV